MKNFKQFIKSESYSRTYTVDQLQRAKSNLREIRRITESPIYGYKWNLGEEKLNELLYYIGTHTDSTYWAEAAHKIATKTFTNGFEVNIILWGATHNNSAYTLYIEYPYLPYFVSLDNPLTPRHNRLNVNAPEMVRFFEHMDRITFHQYFKLIPEHLIIHLDEPNDKLSQDLYPILEFFKALEEGIPYKIFYWYNVFGIHDGSRDGFNIAAISRAIEYMKKRGLDNVAVVKAKHNFNLPVDPNEIDDRTIVGLL